MEQQPTITVENLMVAVIRAAMTAIRTADFIGDDAALDTLGRVIVALGQAVQEQEGETLHMDTPDADTILTTAILRAMAEDETRREGGVLSCGHTEADHAEMRESMLQDPQALVRAIFGDAEVEAEEADGYIYGPNLYL